MLEQKKYTLKELFTEDVLFRIPDYQRGYAWEKKQLDEFWEDITDCIANDKKHYFGSIFLENKNNDNVYYLIDGQQRLTTLSILLYCFIDKLDNSKVKQKYLSDYINHKELFKVSYSDSYEKVNFLQNKIFSNSHGNPGIKDIYEKNLWFCKKYFKTKVSTFENIDSVISALEQNLSFNVQIMTTDFDAQSIFETLNNRGKPLTILEKLKNRLIYLDSKKSDGKLRDEINTVWKQIYYKLGENKNKPLNEDEFISAHLTVYRKPIHEVFSEIGAERKLFQMFCNHPEKFEQDEDKDVDSRWARDDQEIDINDEELENPEAVIDSDGIKIKDYITNLSDFCNAWTYILNPEKNSEIIKKILILSPTKATKTFLTAVIMKFSEDEAEEIFEATEKILFRQSIPEYAAWCETEENLTTLARWINKKEDDEDYLDFEALKKYFYDALDEEENSVEASYVVDGFKNCFNYQRGNKGFYRWSALQYFLFEYEEYLRITPRSKHLLISLDDFSDYSIEHIIPQKCVDDFTDWDAVIEEINPVRPGIAGSEEYKKKNRIIAINTLGNLTLLKTKKEQQLVGCKSWKEKKKLYGDNSRISPNYNFREILSYDEDWGINTIKDRGFKMIDFLGSKLNIEFSDEQKSQILFCGRF